MTPAPFGAELRDVVVRYGDEQALDGADVAFRPGIITGLIGRNGAGKTTLLSLLASLRRPTSGTVRVDGVDPFEDPLVMAGVHLVRESGDVIGDEPVRRTLRYYAATRPNWSTDLAAELLDVFAIVTKKSPNSLSRGQRSALGAVLGLASRAPLTIFDEVYLSMDAPSRYAFYDAVLADYAEHPRTIIISSHLIEEVERLFEDVVIIDRGRVLVADSADAIRARGTGLTGPADAVEAIAREHTVLARQRLGGVVRVTLDVALDDDARRAVRAAGVEVDSVGLQDLFVHLTRKETP
ncbi:ABC transporter related [Beutenbergia cavernae DSM 12333]|uniref:ABC transporter related n=1 Tax=Beutenbergia cavernae (strain ATCC BAA-8 / DSM 12333 / CCUG 43141 / JCM 11478 / NBRC 16432 / NCIMB 13614 / HKI 0122) TaxID=471853 RepID=C5BX73_BEUC1|nr:ABC transporter ATP-binding protein [Beutenbergia cavernae]ACQ78748.1 ABC transporter related [Beutenbergia cavernae DSM 12333]